MNNSMGNLNPVSVSGAKTEPDESGATKPAEVTWVPIEETQPLFGPAAIFGAVSLCLGIGGLLSWAQVWSRNTLLRGLHTGLDYAVSKDGEPASAMVDTLFALICLVLFAIGMVTVGRRISGMLNPSEMGRLGLRVVSLLLLFLATGAVLGLLDDAAKVFVFQDASQRAGFIFQLLIVVVLVSLFLFAASRDSPNQLCRITVYGSNELYDAQCPIHITVPARLATSSTVQNFVGKVESYGSEMSARLNVITQELREEFDDSLRGGSQVDRGWNSAIDTERFATLKKTLDSSFDEISHALHEWVLGLVEGNAGQEFGKKSLVVVDVRPSVLELATRIREEYHHSKQIQQTQAGLGMQLEGETIKAAIMNQKMRAANEEDTYIDLSADPALQPASLAPDRGANHQIARLTEKISSEVGFENLTKDQLTRWSIDKVLGNNSQHFIQLINQQGGVLTQTTVERALTEMLNPARTENEQHE